MNIIFFIFFFFSLLSGRVSEAAPAPRGLAINEDAKECAGYWAGDEFVNYSLPEGWKAYYPTYTSESRWGRIKTDAGECGFQTSKEEACCSELGYVFVSENIGKDYKTVLRDRAAFNKELELRRENGKHTGQLPMIRLVAFSFILFVLVGGIIAAVRLVRKKR